MAKLYSVYFPQIDTTTLSDDEIELWYGSKFAVDFLRLIEGCDISKIGLRLFFSKKYYTLMKYCLINKEISFSSMLLNLAMI